MRTCTPVAIVFSILSRQVCIYVSQLAVTGTVECNKSQRKLASSRCTLIHSIVLSLCALFSPLPNTETLNLHTQIHQGHKVCVDAKWYVHSKTHTGVHAQPHSQAHTDRMHASCADTYWFVHGQRHTSSRGVWKPNVRQTYGDSPHDPLPNHVEQTETVTSATTSNLLYMIYYTDTHRLSNSVCV